MDTESIIPDESLVAEYNRINTELRALADREAELLGERESLLSSAATSAATLKVGQEVLIGRKKRRHRITRIEGDYTQFMSNVKPRIFIRYHGKQIKADGSLSATRETWLHGWELTPEQETHG